MKQLIIYIFLTSLLSSLLLQTNAQSSYNDSSYGTKTINEPILVPRNGVEFTLWALPGGNTQMFRIGGVNYPVYDLQSVLYLDRFMFATQVQTDIPNVFQLKLAASYELPIPGIQNISFVGGISVDLLRYPNVGPVPSEFVDIYEAVFSAKLMDRHAQLLLTVTHAFVNLREVTITNIVSYTHKVEHAQQSFSGISFSVYSHPAQSWDVGGSAKLYPSINIGEMEIKILKRIRKTGFYVGVTAQGSYNYNEEEDGCLGVGLKYQLMRL